MFPTLTDEQRRFVSTVRELAQSEFRERAQRYMDGTFPWENMKPLAELGVLGMAEALQQPQLLGLVRSGEQRLRVLDREVVVAVTVHKEQRDRLLNKRGPRP